MRKLPLTASVYSAK